MLAYALCACHFYPNHLAVRQPTVTVLYKSPHNKTALCAAACTGRDNPKQCARYQTVGQASPFCLGKAELLHKDLG